MKKLSNKILFIGLIVLVVGFVASRFFRSPGLESNLRKELLKLDTAVITEIRILPSKERVEELKLKREGASWKVIKGQRIESANRATIKSMLGSLVELHAQRMVSRKKEKWQDFNVGENSTHVSVYKDGDPVADFHVGKLGFTQSSAGGFGGAYTYVRLSDENEVYAVEGFLESTFNNSFTDLRDKVFLKVNKENILKISFGYPADSSFVIEKRDSLWYSNMDQLDLSKVEGLLNQFNSTYLTEFVDGFVPVSPPQVSIQATGKSGELVSIQGWRRNESEWTLASSIQKGVYFSSKGSTGLSNLFVGRKKVMP